MIPIPVYFQAPLALGVLGLLFVGFLTERYPPAAIALFGATVYLLLGFISTDELMGVFSNPAPVTIGALFVVSGALVRTGVLEAVSNRLVKGAEAHPALTIALMILGTMIVSAIMNNTPVVMVLIPIAIKVASAAGIAPTRLLIPISYAAVLGGTWTLIGTSSNLLVDGVARSSGLEAFDIFEITPFALVGTTAGILTLLLLGPWLLPNRDSRSGMISGAETEFMSEFRVTKDSPLIGRSVGDVARLNRPGMRVLHVRRSGSVVRALTSEVKLEAGDVVILMATAPELLTLNEDEDMRLGIRAPYRSEEVTTLEAFVAPQADSGYRLPELNLGSRFGATVLGVSRQNHRPGLDLRNVRLRPADRVLLEGPKDRLANLAEETSLMAATEPSARSFRRRRAPIAVGTLLAIVTLAAFDVMPIGALALLGVAFILVMRCIDADEAWASVDGSILILIISMLAVGTALQNTGAIEMLVGAAAPIFAVMPPWLIIFALYGLTSLLTELVTNNAIAVIVTPIAIGLAQSAGIDPRVLVMTVMLATSASFATPVGYQTNTLVYGAANYRFTDFLKIGLPMNLVVGLATSAALSLML